MNKIYQQYEIEKIIRKTVSLKNELLAKFSFSQNAKTTKAYDFLNRIIHGDCLEIMRHMPNESIDMVLTDPPYLVNYQSRDGRKIAGDRSGSWLKPAFAEIYRVLKKNSFLICFYGFPWVDEFMNAWKAAGFKPLEHFVWKKNYSSSKDFAERCHESAYLLGKGWPKQPSIIPPSVLEWQYTGNKLHPTQKPIVALLPLIKAYSKKGSIILDPFAGSGSTADAAKKLGRQHISIEIDQNYADIALRRLKGKNS